MDASSASYSSPEVLISGKFGFSEYWLLYLEKHLQRTLSNETLIKSLDIKDPLDAPFTWSQKMLL